MVKREQTAIGVDPENKRWLERHTATTGESMSNFLNKRVVEWRESHPDITTGENGKPLTTTEARQAKREMTEHSIRLFLKENDHILYMAKVQHKMGKNDLLKIKDELFFSKYKVETNTEVIKPIFRDEIEKFDEVSYEKKKGLKRRSK